MSYHHQIQNFAPEQIQSNKATVSSGISLSPRNEHLRSLDVFGRMFQALMSSEVMGGTAGEVSHVYGTPQAPSRTEDRKLFSQPTSETSRVKGIKEDYNQNEHHNFQWMMQEAKKLKSLLDKFETVLAGQGGL